MDTFATDVKEPAVVGFRNRLVAFSELTKPRIAFLLVMTSAAGFYLGSKGPIGLVLFFNTVIAITLLAFGVATLNQYRERDLDRLMVRTSLRPLPTSRITPIEALLFGILQCVIAEVYLLLLVNPLTAFLGLLVIIGYLFLYTPLKTRTSVSTAIGAFPGALPPLMGWTAAANEISVGAWALFATQFLWQFPHFLSIAWLYREEYAKAGILMLPVVEPSGRITGRQIVVFTIMLLPVSLAPYFIAFRGSIFLFGAAIIGVAFLWMSVRAALVKTNERARQLLHASVIYVPLLFILMVADKR